MLAEFSEIRPHHSLVFYSNNNSFAPIATLHTIIDGQLGNGKLVSAEEISQLVNMDAENRGATIYPPGTVGASNTGLLFFRPSRYQSMWFRLHGKRSTRLIRRVPPLLWYASHTGEKIHLYALKKNTLPGPDTEVFCPPFMNCTRSSICWGSAQPKLSGLPIHEWPDHIEDTFFNQSVFSHTGGADTLKVNGRPTDDSMAVFKWWKAQPERTSRFKSSALLPISATGLTVREVLK